MIKHFKHNIYTFTIHFSYPCQFINKGVLQFKPYYENQVYLAHYAKHKTLTHQEASKDIDQLFFGAHMANFDISFGFVVSQEMMSDIYVLSS